mmetsp:Transcript_31950/g.35878  ORF Transcript_31950/g.35878 Transcript_31950/m.35878 type:complete len:95 (+) Transcript_31950:171-455(+)
MSPPSTKKNPTDFPTSRFTVLPTLLPPKLRAETLTLTSIPTPCVSLTYFSGHKGGNGGNKMTRLVQEEDLAMVAKGGTKGNWVRSVDPLIETKS